MKKLGLYIHIPFCQKKCDYCNFVSYCTSDDTKLLYVQNLMKEIVLQSKSYKDYEVDSIFVGGGTPSCLPVGCIFKILNTVYKNFKVLTTAEITVECNPNSLTISKLNEFKRARVNRLSIGLQCYNDKLLKLIGRLHTKKDFDLAVKRARVFGFKNISADIILGVPNQKLFDVKKELKHLVKLGINHISAYGLIVEDNTLLKQKLDKGEYKLPPEDLQVKMYDFTNKYLAKHNINRYEVSNFAKAGCESKHNIKYWTDQEYLGLGVVSSSYINSKRWKATDDLLTYHENLKNGKMEKLEIEELDNNSKMEECIMLSLRTSKGINLTDFKNKFGIDLLKQKEKQIKLLLDGGYIKIDGNHLFCTDSGFKLLNQIVLQLV
ncbi:MAG: radical SAM family heme chaperone HemW [Christensenellales bacterium]